MTLAQVGMIGPSPVANLGAGTHLTVSALIKSAAFGSQQGLFPLLSFTSASAVPLHPGPFVVHSEKVW